ncbi:hypothetical protein [Burkholderia ubonensis]|uniref:hypothetical protein n=1 Tax=Burkholderia ubonensis TaxID=101571 RepID=UPI000A60E8B4|nr:hypothetical protein [Burkholderia ubonensis]
MIDRAAIRRKDVSSLQQGAAVQRSRVVNRSGSERQDGPRRTIALNQPASMIPGAIRFKKDDWKKHL